MAKKAAAKKPTLTGLKRENGKLKKNLDVAIVKFKEVAELCRLAQHRAAELQGIVEAMRARPRMMMLPNKTIEFPDANTTLVSDRNGNPFWVHGVHKTINPVT